MARMFGATSAVTVFDSRSNRSSHSGFWRNAQVVPLIATARFKRLSNAL
jgi:hypothetical protein